VGLTAAKSLAKGRKSGANPSVIVPESRGELHRETTHMTTQAELIASVAKDAGVSQADAGRMLDALVKNIHKSLIGGGDVRISNLGVFDTAARAAREGRNPATGATIKIAASKAVRFRVSKPLKDAVNG